METTAPAQAEEPARPADLRVELFQDLSKRFAAALSSNASLPVAAQEALFELLNSDAPTTDEIVAAASKSDPVKKEAGDE